ncbi:hypothetical protein [Nocardioides jensenii]|uniref:hypothetical protein n=1 Tax=Nocardioides jensenii TaxID=1843 RepID=UPI0012FA9436|nr:hypothetical protein [Nocardioides jensenii]
MKRLLVGAIGTAMVVGTPLALSTNAQAATTTGGDGASAVATPAPATNQMPAAADGLTASGVNARAAQTRTLTSQVAVRKQARGTYAYQTMIAIQGRVRAHNSADTNCDTEWCHVGATSVRLYRRIGGTSKWVLLSNRATNSTSAFVFKTRSVGTAVYKVVFRGKTISGVGTIPAAAASNTIKGSRHPHTRVYTKSGRVYMAGNVDPGWGGKRVIIQRKASKRGSFRAWNAIRTSRSGGYKLRLPAPRTGYWYYRLVVPGTAPRWAAGASGVWRTYQR